MAGVAAFLLAPKVAVAEDPALLLDTRTIPLADDLRHVRANLELARGSVPVLLRVTFVDANGAPLATEALTVRKSSTRELKVPAGARQALFDALKVKPADKPTLQSFAPTASVR